MSLSKVRVQKYKREHDGTQVEPGGRKRASLLQELLKLMLINGKGGTR
jgi:hypothetical protein